MLDGTRLSSSPCASAELATGTKGDVVALPLVTPLPSTSGMSQAQLLEPLTLPPLPPPPQPPHPAVMSYPGVPAQDKQPSPLVRRAVPPLVPPLPLPLACDPFATSPVEWGQASGGSTPRLLDRFAKLEDAVEESARRLSRVGEEVGCCLQDLQRHDDMHRTAGSKLEELCGRVAACERLFLSGGCFQASDDGSDVMLRERLDSLERHATNIVSILCTPEELHRPAPLDHVSRSDDPRDTDAKADASSFDVSRVTLRFSLLQEGLGELQASIEKTLQEQKSEVCKLAETLKALERHCETHPSLMQRLSRVEASIQELHETRACTAEECGERLCECEAQSSAHERRLLGFWEAVQEKLESVDRALAESRRAGVDERQSSSGELQSSIAKTLQEQKSEVCNLAETLKALERHCETHPSLMQRLSRVEASVQELHENRVHSASSAELQECGERLCACEERSSAHERSLLGLWKAVEEKLESVDRALAPPAELDEAGQGAPDSSRLCSAEVCEGASTPSQAHPSLMQRLSRVEASVQELHETRAQGAGAAEECGERLRACEEQSSAHERSLLAVQEKLESVDRALAEPRCAGADEWVTPQRRSSSCGGAPDSTRLCSAEVVSTPSQAPDCAEVRGEVQRLGEAFTAHARNSCIALLSATAQLEDVQERLAACEARLRAPAACEARLGRRIRRRCASATPTEFPSAPGVTLRLSCACVHGRGARER